MITRTDPRTLGDTYLMNTLLSSVLAARCPVLCVLGPLLRLASYTSYTSRSSPHTLVPYRPRTSRGIGAEGRSKSMVRSQSIRQHTSAYVSILRKEFALFLLNRGALVSLCEFIDAL